jgi:GNAT superfamily N-acetyltransferase
MIRAATVNDLVALPAVESSAGTLFAGTHMDWAFSLPARGADAYRPALDQGMLWVAEDDALVGLIAASHAGDCVFIEELSVARSHQRRGIGRALLERLVSESTRCGKPAILPDRRFRRSRSGRRRSVAIGSPAARL